MSLRARARADRERQQDAAARAAREPDELQLKAARDLERLLGQPVNPLDVALQGYQSPYDVVSYRLGKVILSGRYLWGGGDRRHHLAGAWLATRRGRGARDVRRLGDLDGWL